LTSPKTSDIRFSTRIPGGTVISHVPEHRGDVQRRRRRRQGRFAEVENGVAEQEEEILVGGKLHVATASEVAEPQVL
jgi:hypothetical protein